MPFATISIKPDYDREEKQKPGVMINKGFSTTSYFTRKMDSNYYLQFLIKFFYII